jgi:uncharacterized membrane protein
MPLTAIPLKPLRVVGHTLPENHLRPARISSIDLLRGIVMIIMALDHVRDYFHADAMLFDPTDLSQTYPSLFATRWITHFCAPVFMFLAGTSAFLVSQQKGRKAASRFMFTRGLWLVLLELTVINFGWTFNYHFPVTLLITIWALGVSMIALSAFMHLPYKAVLITGIIIVAGHNALDGVHVAGNSAGAFGWAMLHEQQYFTYFNHGFITGYPVMPWIGIILLGYCFGKLYTRDFSSQKRKQWLLSIGLSAVSLFIVLRTLNLYGDANHWEQQKSLSYTIMSIFNVTKYPPSLLYACITLGPAIALLAYAENIKGKLSSAVIHFGRVPMFYYILHIYLIHALAMVAAEATGFGWQAMIATIFPQVKGYGFSLAVVYAIWIGIVFMLYPLCKWYDQYKTTHKEKWWLSYL